MKEKRWFIVLALLFLLVLPERALASSGTLDIITTGKKFSDIEFHVLEADGKTRKVITNPDGDATVKDLPFGRTVIELKEALKDYRAKNSSLTVMLSPEDPHVKVEFLFLKKTGRISLQLRDARTKTPLADVLFHLFDTQTKELVAFASTDEKGTLTFDEVPFGTYRLEQETAAPGYSVAPERTVTVVADQTTTVSFENTEKEKVIERIWGTNRIETALEISNISAKKADAVFLVNSRNFPDGLVAGPLAYREQAPVLLTERDELSPGVRGEIQLLGAKTVYILGGEQAVSKNVERVLERQPGVAVRRLSGVNRYATSIAVGNEFVQSSLKPITGAILANGETFPDALSVSAAASVYGQPLLLTRAGELPEETRQALIRWKIQTVTIVGGETAVSSNVATAIEKMGIEVERISGGSRYETSVNVATKFFPEAEAVVLASGTGFADALSGGPFAAKLYCPVLLVDPAGKNPYTKAYLNRPVMQTIRVLGGELAISSTTLRSLLP